MKTQVEIQLRKAVAQLCSISAILQQIVDCFLAFSFGTRLTKSELKETTVRNVTGSFDRDPAILSDCFPSSVRLQLMRAMAPSWKPVGKPSLSSCVGSKNNLLCKFPEIGFGYLLCWFTYLQ